MIKLAITIIILTLSLVSCNPKDQNKQENKESTFLNNIEKIEKISRLFKLEKSGETWSCQIISKAGNKNDAILVPPSVYVYDVKTKEEAVSEALEKISEKIN